MATKKSRKRESKPKDACATHTCDCHLTYTEMFSIVFGIVGAASATLAFFAISMQLVG